VDATGTPGADGPEGWSAREGVHPDDITAPQPVVTGPHHHVGTPGRPVSPPGHHVAAPPPAGRGRGLAAVAGVAAGVLVLGTVGAVILSRAGSDPAAAGTPTASASSPAGVGLTPGAAEPADATDTATPPPLPPSQDTLILGDSLGLTVYPWLADLLPDRYVSYQAEVGRSTPATRKKLESLTAVPQLVIVSSGTNDPVANVLEESARKILDDLGPSRCVVWVDVVRPDTVGDSQTMMNAALDRALSGRSNVRLLHWTELVAEHPEWMSGDGIHPNEVGSQGRAQAFADAARGCSALDPAAPRAKRQYLPQSAFWGPVSGQYRPPTSGPTHGSTASRTPSPSTSTSASPPGSPSTTRPAPPPPTSTSPPPPDPTTPPPAETSPPPAASGSA
jgi:hypothetical protein